MNNKQSCIVRLISCGLIGALTLSGCTGSRNIEDTHKIGENPDFWIESSLTISPREQAEVMERIFGEDSFYSETARNELKEVMMVDTQGEAGNPFISAFILEERTIKM